jgi:hypothetical protein
MKIKGWKLFEGYYQDSIKRIEEINKEIVDIRANYLLEVKDCIWDLIDDFGAKYIDESELDENYDSLCVYFEIESTIDSFNNLLDVLLDCNVKCELHIGKSIKFDYIGIFSKNVSYYNLNNLLNGANIHKSFIHKVEYIRNNIEGYYEDDTNAISIIIVI